MKILLLNWRDLVHPKAGGAEVYAYEIARHWVNSGHEVTWFCAAVEGHPAEEVKDGIRIVRRGGRLGVYREARKFYECEGRGNYDLVIDEVNTRPFLTPRYVDDTAHVALIHQVCREIWWYEAPWPAAILGRFWLEKRWLNTYRDTPVLTISESSRKSFIPYGIPHARIVPVGLDPIERPDVPREERPTVLYVGRLSRNKRPDHAIKAFEILRREVPDAQLWVVGDGPMRAKLERKAPEGVTFFGRVSQDEKHELMARAHVLACVSVREGWGLVVDEAAAMGTPSVGYDIPGFRDSIHAAGGVVVAARPEALATALAKQMAAVAPEAGWSGGALPWAEVATVVLAEAAHATTSV